MNHSYQTLLLKTESSTLWISLNRPEVHNAFNEIMITELTQVFSEVSQNNEVRCIVLTGEGESFCAGADLHWMKKMVNYSKEENIADSQKLFRMFESIQNCPKPVLAFVNGNAIGGGTGLVASVDIAFADVEKAQFAFSEVRLGLIPAVISPFVLKKIGQGNAREYFLTAERFNASIAEKMGLVQHSGSKAEMLEKIDQKLKALGFGAPQAIAASKKLIQEVSESNGSEVAQLTPQRIAERRVSEEGQEGMNAFLSKRKPKWG